MDTEAWRTLLNRNKMFHFYMLNSVISYKSGTYEIEIDLLRSKLLISSSSIHEESVITHRQLTL